ncbi:hypothetical protein V6N13_091320 [Hibiscus sabdariffa]
MKELGYDNDAWLHFRVPGVVFSTYALVLVVDDDAVRQIVGFLNTRGIVELYVVVGNARGSITEADENAVNEVVGNAVNDIDEDEHEAINEVGEKGTSQDSIDDEVADIEDLGHSTAEVEQEPGEKETSQDSADFLVNVEIASDLDDEVERIRVNLRADRYEISTDVSEGEENNDDKRGSQPNVGNDLFEEDEDVAEVEGKLQDHESDYIESDEPGEYGESGDDSGDQICGAYMGRGKKQVGHKYDSKCAFPLWELGLRFEDHKQFKEAVRKYAIANGVALRFKKSEPKRVRVCYKVGCPWSLFASIDKRYDCFLVKTYYPVHKCVRTNKNPILTSKNIENVFRDRILADPSMKVETLKQHCRKELGVYASFNKCQRARLNVLREKRGSYIEEYATIWGYATELLHSNPGSTISIQVHRDSDNKAIFHRMYICFDALKKGWKEGCRPFIGVDGCFLKTATQGELLVAIGGDGNNQMFPVAWAVVEGEGNESWKWFLTKLMQDLNHPDGEGLTLMSDQQKGLVPIINQFFPALEHRMCARNIYSNWHKKWKGMNKKIQFWNCVRSTFVEDFDDQLKILEEMGATSTNDLLAIPPLHWSRAYFTGNSKCDVVDNNLAEAFNGWIVDARCHPIISMLEKIRKIVMQRLHVKRSWVNKWKTNIAPRAQQKLEKNMELSVQCRLVWNGDGGFEVTHGENQHTVNLNTMQCTCREWELTGIPCCHAICAMYHDSKEPQTFISEWYTKERYLVSYKHVLQPVKGKKFWLKREDDPIGPPKLKVMPGRPKKKRRKDKSEPVKQKYGKLSSAGFKITCSNCKQVGHRKNKCTNPGQASQSDNNARTTRSMKMKFNETETVAVRLSVSNRKRQVGIGIYTDLRTGEQTLNPGLPSEQVVTRVAKRKIGASISQYNHASKGPGLKWRGKQAVTTRQLQQQQSDQRRQSKRRTSQKPLDTQSSQTDANANN